MSSIRLFILSSFAEHGPMHGHRLRLEAERRHVTLWTDITVGAVYGAMKRLSSEGLLQETAREQVGKRPARQVYQITEKGHKVLTGLRRLGLEEVWFRYDPFDLALTRMDAELIADLPDILAVRLELLTTKLVETKGVNSNAQPSVGMAKQWALRHTEYRLEAEISYLTDLIANVSVVVTDELKS